MRILAIIAAGLLAGCTTARMPVEYRVEAFTLVLCDARMIAPAEGCCDMKNRVIYVRRSVNDADRPDLETLGHEVWHLVKGRWHK